MKKILIYEHTQIKYLCELIAVKAVNPDSCDTLPVWLKNEEECDYVRYAIEYKTKTPKINSVSFQN